MAERAALRCQHQIERDPSSLPVNSNLQPELTEGLKGLLNAIEQADTSMSRVKSLFDTPISEGAIGDDETADLESAIAQLNSREESLVILLDTILENEAAAAAEAAKQREQANERAQGTSDIADSNFTQTPAANISSTDRIDLNSTTANSKNSTSASC